MLSRIFSQQLIWVLAITVPLSLGSAESTAPEKASTATSGTEATTVAQTAQPKKSASTCLASEEVIQDLSIREQKIKERESQLADSQKEIELQKKVIQEEMAKLEALQAKIQGVRAQEMAAREEQVNKLIETFETMSPKAAASVLAEVDEELAVTTLTRLSNVKAGKILANLKPEKSSRLSEKMAFGKEKERGESQRAPANQSKR